jgi:hypothetical protein
MNIVHKGWQRWDYASVYAAAILLGPLSSSELLIALLVVLDDCGCCLGGVHVATMDLESCFPRV